jgi:hypothetical protein
MELMPNLIKLRNVISNTEFSMLNPEVNFGVRNSLLMCFTFFLLN